MSRRRLDLAQGRVELAHGGGGRAMGQLVEEMFRTAFANPALARAEDASPIGGGLVMTTDSFVVSPLFFPGGDIGSLAVHGTVNDLAMAAAEPVALSAAFVLEEGFPLRDLSRIAASMAAAARDVGVPIVTGDTKVVERGKGDGVFITTTGIGRMRAGVAPGVERVRPGDAVLVNGFVGDHGVAIMAAREGMEFAEPLLSDSAALHGLVDALVDAVPEVHCLRDPTRGGLAATLNEIADRAGCGMVLQESAIPVRPAVAAACELLGLDPLHVANEGKLLAVVPVERAADALAALRAHPLGRAAAVIGTVTEDPRRTVQMETSFGGRRMVDWLAGEQLPRIC